MLDRPPSNLESPKTHQCSPGQVTKLLWANFPECQIRLVQIIYCSVKKTTSNLVALNNNHFMKFMASNRAQQGLSLLYLSDISAGKTQMARSGCMFGGWNDLGSHHSSAWLLSQDDSRTGFSYGCRGVHLHVTTPWGLGFSQQGGWAPRRSVGRESAQ